MDSITYRAQRERECSEVSAVPIRDFMVAEEAGGIADRIRLIGVVHLRDEAFVKVHEIVDLAGGHVHRIKYAYYLVVADREIGGYERDPIHDPAEHFHCTERDGGHLSGGEPADAVSFKQAIEHAWEWLSHNY